MSVRSSIAGPSSPHRKRRWLIAGVATVVVAGAMFLGGCYLLGASAEVGEYAARFAGAETPPEGAVSVTYLGTSTLLFDDGATWLLIDGFFSRPGAFRSLFLPIRTDERRVDAVFDSLRALGILNLERDSIGALFVTHAHYDHALDVAHVVQRTRALLYGSPSTLLVGEGGDLRASRMTRFHADSTYDVGAFRVTVLRSAHAPMHPLLDDLGEEVTSPLRQPALSYAYKEGGSYDFLIEHGALTILVKPSAGVVGEEVQEALEASLGDRSVDVLFLGVGGLGKQPSAFRLAYYEQALDRLRPGRVIPIHWDDFSEPLSEPLRFQPRLADHPSVWMEELIARADPAGIDLDLLRGFQRVALFPAEPREADL